MDSFEFLVPKRPLSHQAKNKAHRREWQEFVFSRAYNEWNGRPVIKDPLEFTLVFICEEDPPDINNIIKPVQDALIGLVYSDDKLVIDVQGHIRMTQDLIDVTGLPPLLRDAIFIGVDCIYVRVSPSVSLSDVL